MINIELFGTSEASACGRTVKARGMGGPIGKLARQLITDGYAAHDVVVVCRSGKPAFSQAMLSYWAERDATEGDGFSCRMVRHRAFEADIWDK